MYVNSILFIIIFHDSRGHQPPLRGKQGRELGVGRTIGIIMVMIIILIIVHSDNNSNEN